MTDTALEDQAPPSTAAALLDALRLRGARGYHRNLDDAHTATFAARGDTLIVTFEDVEQTLARDSGVPVSFDFADDKNWSLLHLSSARRTWFRGSALTRFFDDLADGAFFDDFDRVVFYGAGPGGFAAAAYSVAAPGARVIAVEPQGAVGLDRAGWDKRFRDQFPATPGRRYADPGDLIRAADRAFILYDPTRLFDHIHATFFHGENVTLVPAPGLAPDDDTTLETALDELGALHPLIECLGSRDGTRTDAHRILRLRRKSLPWTLALLERAARRGHAPLVLKVIDGLRQENDRVELRQLRRHVRTMHRATG